ncbi:MAG: FHA domain-containing protein [Nocardioides sp.]
MAGTGEDTMFYAPGAGLLLGSGARWLLLADQPDESVIERLWEALITVGVDQALAVLEQAYAGNVPAVATWDRGRGSGQGGGEVGHDESPMLTVGLPVDGPWFPVIGGIVAGGAARWCPARRPSTGLIDKIPDEVRAAVGPDVPRRFSEPALAAEVAGPGRVGVTGPVPAPAPAPAEPRDHDGHTTVRQRAAAAAQDQPVDHLRQPTHETVLAVWCLRGHPTPAYPPQCRVCHEPLASQEPQRVPRPRLGRLRLPSGEVVPLDRGVVIGRRPAPVDQHGEWPHLVTVPPEASHVSRVHVQIVLDGWHVVARDLGSRGGTTLLVPGRAPGQIRAQEPHVLEPGQALDLAEEFQVVYEVEPG